MQASGRARLRKAMKYACAVLGLRGLPWRLKRSRARHPRNSIRGNYGRIEEGHFRRNLLKGATLSAAGVAALGMFGCSPAGGSSSSSSKSGRCRWREEAHVGGSLEAITDIAETVETEVLVIGAGYSGTCCALNAAQNGVKVTFG